MKMVSALNVLPKNWLPCLLMKVPLGAENPEAMLRKRAVLTCSEDDVVEAARAAPCAAPPLPRL